MTDILYSLCFMSCLLDPFEVSLVLHNTPYTLRERSKGLLSYMVLVFGIIRARGVHDE